MRRLSFFLAPLLATACFDGLLDVQINLPDDDAPTQVAEPELPVFDIDRLVDNLDDAFADTAGAQIVVVEDGQLYEAWAIGNAVYAPDPEGDVPMDLDERMTISSVSKFIGTIALMDLLEAEGIDVDEPIRPYLPPTWRNAMHPDHFAGGSPFVVTFEGLLTKDTALAFPTGSGGASPGRHASNDEMLQALTAPAAPGRWGSYQNGNFTLLRVLVGELAYDLDETSDVYDDLSSEVYADHLNQWIFGPLGIDPVGHVRPPGAVSRAYRFPFDPGFTDATGALGWLPRDRWPVTAGSTELYMTAVELAEVVAFFRHDAGELLLSEAQRDNVLDLELGLTESVDGDHGRYPSKQGGRGPDGSTRGYRSRVMFYPNDVEVVVITNSYVTSLGPWLRDAYDDAWVTP
ncbi:MAG: serine hydrolase domain-containing protein [Myxococcota bacterium]